MQGHVLQVQNDIQMIDSGKLRRTELLSVSLAIENLHVAFNFALHLFCLRCQQWCRKGFKSGGGARVWHKASEKKSFVVPLQIFDLQVHAQDTFVLSFLLYYLFPEYEQRTLYGALVVTLAMLLRRINCRFIISIIITISRFDERFRDGQYNWVS